MAENVDAVIAGHMAMTVLSANEIAQLTGLAAADGLTVLHVAADLLGGHRCPDPQVLAPLLAAGALTVDQVRWIHVAGHVLAALGIGTPAGTWPQPERCGGCHDRGYVPDWSNWNSAYGEPSPKPCPHCTPPPVPGHSESADPGEDPAAQHGGELLQQQEPAR